MRVAVLSDIHSNLVALDAVLAGAGSVDAVWHLGDVVGYGPEPDGVVERLVAVGAVGVAGNHDRAAVGGREIDWFNEDAKAAMEWTRGRISAATVDWLRALPETRTESETLLVHGSPRDPIWEYVMSASIARANFEVLPTRVGLYGHTHLPAAWARHGDRVTGHVPDDGPTVALGGDDAFLVNPGSVGQPRDGDPRAGWLELDTATWTGTWHRVAYDVRSVQAAMRDAGLPIRLAERLQHGL
ncbi:MAG TPA: metallophosphoesterase family protein [Candidatus Limnocylindrales bacterium]|jgi:diadenosine tetraphosphatase ApaH/serine/threonine PP2A family protein phosphatase